MNDLFNTPDQVIEQTLRDELTAKWKEKFPEAPPELLEAKINSDVYIKMLERQKDEMRNDIIAKDKEIQARSNMEEIIDRMNRQTPGLPPEKPEEKPTTPDLKDIESLFERKYEEKQIHLKEMNNFNQVQKMLQERFGNNAATVLAEQSNTLGLTKEDVNALAKKSPEAFFRMMGLQQQQQGDLFNAPPRSGVRNDNYIPKIEKRSWNYYQDMKKKDPRKYWDPKTQLQMHKDSEALGNAFEDGDY